MQLSTAGELVFPATNTRLPGFRRLGPAGEQGNICVPRCAFVVRFGIKDGEQRAYLTVDYHDDNPGTLVDVEVANGALVVTQTELYPPGSPTLSGVVTEAMPTGPAPVAGVTVYRGVIVAGEWRRPTRMASMRSDIRDRQTLSLNRRDQRYLPSIENASRTTSSSRRPAGRGRASRRDTPPGLARRGSNH